MRNNKGVTLITVVVMIIIIMIIATTSLLSAGKLLNNSKNMVGEQEIEAVRQAINARQAEINMQGTITPTGDVQYVGKLSPGLAKDSIIAKGWYSLNEQALKELGVNNLKALFLVNYQKGIVIPLEDEHHVEKYLVYAYMNKVYDKRVRRVYSDYIGERLSNSTTIDSGKMYVDMGDPSSKDVYGNGWFKVEKEQILAEIEGDYTAPNVGTYLKDSYLVNYEDNKFVAFTSTMELK